MRVESSRVDLVSYNMYHHVSTFAVVGIFFAFPFLVENLCLASTKNDQASLLTFPAQRLMFVLFFFRLGFADTA